MSSFEIEYYTRECKLRELEYELNKCESELLKWKAVNNVNTSIYQPWPPYKTIPLFFYRNWTESFGQNTVFTDIILIEPIFTFKPGWHFHKVIFDACKCTLTFQNIDNFIPKNILVYKEYTCILEMDKLTCTSITN